MATTTFTHVIPQGYVGILRWLKWEFTDTDGDGLPDIGRDEWTGRLLVNGTVVPNYDQLEQLGRHIGDPIPVYALANSGQMFEVEFSINQVAASFDITCWLYGQELLSKDVPLNLEPGTAEAVKGKI